jgi:hypothetical protein
MKIVTLSFLLLLPGQTDGKKGPEGTLIRLTKNTAAGMQSGSNES